MDTIFFEQFLDGGILKEESFRASVDAIDWSQYRDKKVMIKGCSDVPVPTWAYLVITARLAQYAGRIVYGEPCSAVRIFTRDGKR
ncbi:MAG: DUF2480 family protein [Candidatus Neomarinimicrobiota bacterium]